MLIYIRVPFSYDSSVGGSIRNSKFIFSLSTSEYVYVIYYGESAIDPYGKEDLEHKLNYYLNPEEYKPSRNDYELEYFGLQYQPNFDRVYVSTKYTYLGGNYAVLKVYDAKSLNFLLTTNNDEQMLIFSGDYDLSFLEKYLDGYYENKEKCFSYNYMCNKYQDYIANKKFIFYDTYADDENDNYLLITGYEKIKNKIEKFFNSISKDI